MKYRVLCHILVFLLCVGGLSAQTVVSQDSTQNVKLLEPSKRFIALNTVHLELLGLGSLYSISYERFLNQNFSIRVAIGGFPLGWYLPATISSFWEIWQGENFLEFGAGIMYAEPYLRGFDSGLFGGLRIGFRYLPLAGGFNIGIAFTPLIRYYSISNIEIRPWGGISLGWGF